MHKRFAGLVLILLAVGCGTTSPPSVPTAPSIDAATANDGGTSRPQALPACIGRQGTGTCRIVRLYDNSCPGGAKKYHIMFATVTRFANGQWVNPGITGDTFSCAKQTTNCTTTCGL